MISAVLLADVDMPMYICIISTHRSNPMAAMGASNFESLAAQVMARPTARPFENYAPSAATSHSAAYEEDVPPPMPQKKRKKGAAPAHKPRVQPTFDDTANARGISIVHHHNDSHQHIHVHHIHQHIHVHAPMEEDGMPPVRDRATAMAAGTRVANEWLYVLVMCMLLMWLPPSSLTASSPCRRSSFRCDSSQQEEEE